MMHLIRISLFLLVLAASTTASRAAGPGDEVVVIYNSALPESLEVARHYAARREVPESRLFGFDLPTDEAISRAVFRHELQEPLHKRLLDEKLLTRKIDFSTGKLSYEITDAKFRYLVICYGVPLKIQPDPTLMEDGVENLSNELRRNEAAVDSELTWLPLLGQKPRLAGPLANGFFGQTNAAALHPTNNIVMVARLDGPDAAIAKGLVDKAIEAETRGLWGRGVFDSRGLTSGAYLSGDLWVKNARDIARRFGFEIESDDLPETLPSNHPLDRVGLYAGWYAGQADGPFARESVDFMPGAIAYHIHSYSASTIRSTNANWVGPLLAKGATATVGFVYEPYLAGTLDLGVFYSRLMLERFTLAEAAWAASPVLSWQTTVVGDPLYRPFGQDPAVLHARLEKDNDPFAAWSHLRVVNLNLETGASPLEMLGYLNQVAITKESPVLLEKQADLYAATGKPTTAALTHRKALELVTQDNAKKRIHLKILDALSATGDHEKTWEAWEEFERAFPGQTLGTELKQRLLETATALNKTEAVARWTPEPKPEAGGE